MLYFTYLAKQAWANIVDPDETSQNRSTLFALIQLNLDMHWVLNCTCSFLEKKNRKNKKKSFSYLRPQFFFSMLAETRLIFYALPFDVLFDIYILLQ